MNAYTSFINVRRIVQVVSTLAAACLVSGCHTGHITLQQPTKPSALEPIRTANAVVPVRVQVVNFTINSIQNRSENVSTEELKGNLELSIGNKLYRSLGARHVFSEVSRVEQSDPNSTDFIVTGDYDFVFKSSSVIGAHVYSKGTMKVRIVEAKTGATFFEQTYVEEHQDDTGAFSRNRAHISWLQAAHIDEITSDIKKAIFHKMGKDQ